MNVVAGVFIGWFGTSLLAKLGMCALWALTFCVWRTYSGAREEYVRWANSTGNPAPRSGSAVKDFYFIEFQTAIITSALFAFASGWVHAKWFT